MDKNKLSEIRKRLLALGVAGGILLSASGCEVSDEKTLPSREPISSSYSNFDSYCYYVMRNGEPVKLYKSENVYLLYDKDTYEVSEFVYSGQLLLGGLLTYVELYDLESGEMLSLCNGITVYNRDYYREVINSNYQVCLSDVENYLEGYSKKDAYTLEEIRELEPLIAENLKIINSLKAKSK